MENDSQNIVPLFSQKSFPVTGIGEGIQFDTKKSPSEGLEPDDKQSNTFNSNGNLTPSSYNENNNMPPEFNSDTWHEETNTKHSAKSNTMTNGNGKITTDQGTLDRILKLEVGIDLWVKFIAILVSIMLFVLGFGLNSIKQTVNDRIDLSVKVMESKNEATLVKIDAIATGIKKDNEIYQQRLDSSLTEMKKDAEISRAKEGEFKSDIKTILLENKQKK